MTNRSMSLAERALSASPGGLGAFVRYFLYLGALGFGGPVALAGFMHRDLVEERRWVSEDEYRLSMALAQIMPGPLAAQLAIALGYFQHGVLGATAAAVGIFLPVYLFTIIPAPWFSRNRNNPQLKAFVQGATAAATGALSGAVIVLAVRAIYDVPTAAIALVSFALLWRFKIPEPLLVVGAGVAGLVIWPLVKGL